MFRHSVRRLAVTAAKAAELPTSHTLAVSKAQSISKGLTGGELVATLLETNADLVFD